jgi:hypothetical protein
MTPDLIRQRLEFLKGERKTPEERWDAIESFIAPYRGEFFRSLGDEHSVELDKSEIYDGTALQSAQVLASNLHGNLTSAYVQWFGLKFKDPELEDDPDAREWLEACGQIIWASLQESNFPHEIAENYLDLTTFASTFMFEEAKGTGLEWDGVLFSALPLKECYFEEDAEGKISRFYRSLMWTPLQIVDKFGEKGLPEDILQKSKGSQASAEKMEVVFAVWPRRKAARFTGALPPLKRPWGYRYVLGRDGTELGKEGGYYEMPVFVARWAKVSESKWGHGPSHVAIYDVQALNRQEFLALQALEKTIDPPQKTTERGVIGDLDLGAGGLTVLRSMDALAPMTFGTEWNVVNMERQNRRNMIKEYYMISRLDLKDSPAMTATEVERRWQQMQKLLGPTLGRLQKELLGPAIETTFNLLFRAKRLPEAPASVAASGADLDIEFTGPLPVSQKADVAAAIERELGLASNLAATFGPEVLDALDATIALREHAKLTAVPAKIVRTEAEVKKRQKGREAQEQEAAELAKAQGQAQVIKDAGTGAGAVLRSIDGGKAEAGQQG